MKKSISFKTAFVIVIALHVLGFYLFSQIASIRTQLAKIAWQERKERLLKQPISSNDWPQSAHTTNPVVTKVEQPIAKPTYPTTQPKQTNLKREAPPKIANTNKPIKPTTKVSSSLRTKEEVQKAIKFLASRSSNTSSPNIVSSTKITKVGNNTQIETVERRVVRTYIGTSNNPQREITIIPIY